MTVVLGPQSPNDSRKVMRLIDANGDVVFAQVGFEELNFGAAFGGKTTSGTTNDVSVGAHEFVLDEDDGRIVPGVCVQMTTQDPDCFMYGFVVIKDTLYAPARIVVEVKVTSALVGTGFSFWEIQIIQMDFAPLSLPAFAHAFLGGL
jgi:hypothetical protein